MARARELHERRRGARHGRLHAVADAAARDVAEAVRGGRLPRRRRHARPAQRLARGRVLRLRHDLRRARARLPRARLRLVANSGPVLARAHRRARGAHRLARAAARVHADDQHAHSVPAGASVSSRLEPRPEGGPVHGGRRRGEAGPRAGLGSSGRPVRRLVRVHVHVSRRLRSRQGGSRPDARAARRPPARRERRRRRRALGRARPRHHVARRHRGGARRGGVRRGGRARAASQAGKGPRRSPWLNSKRCFTRKRKVSRGSR